MLICVEDKLETKLSIPRANTNRRAHPELPADSERTLIGLSDGGAHVDISARPATRRTCSATGVRGKEG